MSITVTGASGFLGSRLVRLLAARGERVVAVDRAPPPAPLPPGCASVVGDLAANVGAAVPEGTAAVVHLAAVVSGAAEADFDLGLRENVFGLHALLEACRARGNAPRFLFASSLAVFGPIAAADDATPTHPASSYGAQKAIGELLVHDYARKGFVDGRSVRLPTIAVRPGPPNAAASGFASAIVREPLAGQRATCPMPRDAKLWLASPDSALRSLAHGLAVDGALFGGYRCVNAPGITASVGDLLNAMERHGGDPGLVDHAPDPKVAALVGSWPATFDTAKADAMGFPRADTLDEAVAAHIETELSGVVGGGAA